MLTDLFHSIAKTFDFLFNYLLCNFFFFLKIFWHLFFHVKTLFFFGEEKEGKKEQKKLNDGCLGNNL
jgi:hypothetical protein